MIDARENEMPQSLTQKTVNNFVRGLITEAAELTFPDGASVDELNCELNRDGSRRRRLAVELESSNVLSSFTITDDDLVHTGEWLNVEGVAGQKFLVVQVGNTLHFYNKSETPYSGQAVGTSIDLSAYEFAGSIGANNAKCQFASIDGALIVASEAIDTIYITWDGSVFTISTIDFKTRDFEWQGDTTTYDEGIASPSTEREYDTANAGWVGDKGSAALTDYETANSKYPALTHPWYAGKDSSGDFDAAEWDKVFAGTSLTGNGHFVLDFFAKDRATASGIAGIATEFEQSRFKSVTAFSGRIFYAGLDSEKNSGTILFSRLIEDKNELGECHQRNDPTAEYLSDLLDTDGGVIRIPEAVGIKLLYTYQTSLFIFAENGVWQINGVDGVFRATEFSISRVSDTGIENPQSFVAAEGVPFWWSRFGIYTLKFDDVSGRATDQNITLPTIQTFWDAIPTADKLKVTALYDDINKRIYWGYPNSNETVESKINNFLILDLQLQAFFPWKVNDQTSSTSSIVGLAFYSGYGADTVTFDVITSVGDDVVTSAGDDVVSAEVSSFATGDPAIVLLIRDGATNKLTMGGFSGNTFLDWGDTNYTSFAETGYDFIGDLVLKKNAPYLVVYSRLTEEGFTGSEATGYELIRPSSLLVSTAWDFKTTFNASQQCYRFKYPLVPDPSDLSTINYPETVMTTRLKIRGHGRSMRMRYESEQGKDFLLLGWGIIQGRNNRY